MRIWRGRASLRGEIGFWRSTLLSHAKPVYTEYWVHPIRSIWGIAIGRWMITVIRADAPRSDHRSDKAAFDHNITKVKS